MSLFIKIISLYNHIHFLAILYPTSLANLVVEVGTRHCHQILLVWLHESLPRYLLQMVSYQISRGFKIPSKLCFGWKDCICSNSCMLVSLKYALISTILWLENPERWNIVTSKKSTDVSSILQETLLGSSWLLNRLMKSDNSSFDLSGDALVLGEWLLLLLGEGRCWLFGILTARESGLLHSCHYLSVKKTAWKIQWPGHLGLN